jgi:hypothetical protein
MHTAGAQRMYSHTHARARLDACVHQPVKQEWITKMPLRTKLTEMLGIEVPIVQGGMHHVGKVPPSFCFWYFTAFDYSSRRIC